ncbi:MAG: phage tail protein [Acutalibacteraceae bacterium]
MYRITCDGATLYDPDNPVLQLLSGTLKTGTNLAGTLTFALSPTHPYRDRVQVRRSVVTVYRDEKIYFRGSPNSVAEDDGGLATVTVEGALAWLNDSVQPFGEYHEMPVRAYLETLIANHNTATDDFKHFTVGSVTVTDANDSLYRHSNFEHTKDAISDKLISRLGGYLQVRWENGVQYLDYLADYGHVNAQGVRFGQNLLTYARSLPSSSLATAIIPLGCRLKDETGADTDERLQIDNGGKSYVWDEEAVERFGWIFDTVIFDDVTLKENLLARGYSTLESRKALPATVKLTAVDFGALDGQYERITVGDLLPVVSAPHNIDTFMMVAEMTENLTDPGKSTVTLNRTSATMTDALISSKKDAAQQLEAVRTEAYTRTDELRQSVTEFEVQVKQNLDGISSSVTETQTQITTTTENIYDALGQLQESIVTDEALEEVKQLLISQWSDELELRFTSVLNIIDQTNGTIEENQRLLEQYIRFEGARIELGRSDSVIKAVLQNDRLSFVESGQEVAYISNRTLFIKDAQITQTLRFGNADSGYYVWAIGENSTYELTYNGP